MKIIGKNSVSQHISYVMLLMFLISFFHLVYRHFASLILWYKYKTGSTIFPNTFILAKDVGWKKNQWTSEIDHLLKYRINYPFTDIKLGTDFYPETPELIIYNCIISFWLTLFFYFAYKFFKEISSDQTFTKNALKWLRRFSYLNLGFAFFGLFEHFLLIDNSGLMFIFHLLVGIFGIIVLFIIEFFKKGLELQNETDLTI